MTVRVSDGAGEGSDTTTVTVGKLATMTSLSSSLNPSKLLQRVTFTSVVSCPSGVPTGTVTFFDGTSAMRTVPMTDGRASFSTRILGIGDHPIRARYDGDSAHSSSESIVITQTVNRILVPVTLVSSVNPSVFGQPVTFTATIPDALGGKVVFLDGKSVLGSADLAGGSAASVTTSSLRTGLHLITALFFDREERELGAHTLVQTVKRAKSATTVSSSPNPSRQGQSVAFVATVNALAPGSGTPGGNVVFKDGNNIIGTAALDSSARATLTTSSLAVGNHVIKAVYQGDLNYEGSSSPSVTQTVTRK